MCGICGIYGEENSALVRKMTSIIAHRGPNDEGYYSSDNISLGMRRLSIIDLKGGHQPIYNEEGDICVVFNGEIYNYRDIREKLIERGHEFVTNCDTEVIVHLYEEMGEDFPRALNGAFAIALWDDSKKKLVCVRDRLGIKPFYYYLSGNSFIFSSEIKAILVYGIDRKLNREALASYFAFMYIPGENTMIDGIKRLLPGRIMVLTDNKILVKKYWSLSHNRNYIMADINHISDIIYENVRKAVKMRLMSDVPLGSTLSGGVDSSLVVGLMGRMVDEPVKTFTVSFDENDEDFRASEEISSLFDTDHHTMLISSDEGINALPSAIYHQEDISYIGNELPTYFFSKLASNHVTVFLVGEGADEVFAGYKFHRLFAPSICYPTQNIFVNNEFYDGTESIARKFILTFISRLPPYAKFAVFKKRQSLALSNKEMQLVGLRDKNVMYRWIGPYLKVAKPFDAILLFGLEETVPHFHCIRLDKLSMAHSTEARVPYLDHIIVELGWQIPPKYKIDGFVTKYALKIAASRLIPMHILKKKKRGLSTPIFGRFEKQVDDIIKSIDEDFMGYHAIQRLIRKRQGREGHRRLIINQKIFALLQYYIWEKIFINEEKPERVL